MTDIPQVTPIAMADRLRTDTAIRVPNRFECKGAAHVAHARQTFE
jgi:hypothetical protein